jgi:hypothetical protein
VIYSVNYSFVRRQADKNRSRRRKSNGGFRVPEAKAAAPLLLPSVSQSGAEDRKSGAKARRDVQGPGVCRCERAAPQRVLGLRVAFCAVGVMFASFLSLFLLSVLYLPPCLRAFFFFPCFMFPSFGNDIRSRPGSSRMEKIACYVDKQRIGLCGFPKEGTRPRCLVQSF